MRDDLRDWSRELIGALQERRISNNAAAQRVNVSPATFTSWANGVTRPSVEALPAIARLTGLSVWYLHELAGYLPDSYAPATAVIQATETQRGLYRSIRRWAEQSLEATGLTPAAHAAGLILDHDKSWELTLRPNVKGQAHPIASHTLIGLRQPRGNSRPLHEIRRELDAAIGPSLTSLGVRWRNRRVPGWPDAPDLLLEVPEFERTRAATRSDATPTPLPPVIAVLGVPYAHAELVGALAADAVGYGYVNSYSEICARFELGLGPSNQDVAESGARLLQTNLERRDGFPRRTVWTCAYPEAFEEPVIDALAERTDQFFVYVRVGPRLLEFGADVWKYDLAKCRAMADRLEAFAERMGPHRCGVVTLTDAEVFARDAQDGVTDQAVRAAASLLELLDVRPQDRTGYLGDL
jgi:transcriptional regulator with XRE-family HTH domain